MSETKPNSVSKESGWQPMPLPLKILFIVLILWLIGSVINLPNLYEHGMPLFGNMVYGMNAAILPLLVDIIAPSIFLFALWTRKSWAVGWALIYNGIFIINNVVAFFTVREELGLPQILVPTIVSALFLTVIFWKRDYFTQSH